MSQAGLAEQWLRAKARRQYACFPIFKGANGGDSKDAIFRLPTCFGISPPPPHSKNKGSQIFLSNYGLDSKKKGKEKKCVEGESSVEPGLRTSDESLPMSIQWGNLRSWVEKLLPHSCPTKDPGEDPHLSSLGQDSFHSACCCPGYVTWCEAVTMQLPLVQIKKLSFLRTKASVWTLQSRLSGYILPDLSTPQIPFSIRNWEFWGQD